jgi:hypothetical protein
VAVVGAPLQDENGTKTGAAYVFDEASGPWDEVAKLVPPDGEGENTDEFGVSVGVDGDRIVAGMHNDGEPSLNQSKIGSAYLFERNVGGRNMWGLLKALSSLDKENNDEYGFSVAAGGNTVAIGAPFTEDLGAGSSNDAGGVFIYRLKYNNPPRLGTPLPPFFVAEGPPVQIEIPAGAFVDPDFPETLVLISATQFDDTALPSVDPLSAVLDSGSLFVHAFSGSAAIYGGTGGTPLGIKITAADDEWLAVSTTTSLTVLPPDPSNPVVAGSGGAIVPDLPGLVGRLRIDVVPTETGPAFVIRFRHATEDATEAFAVDVSPGLSGWRAPYRVTEQKREIMTGIEEVIWWVEPSVDSWESGFVRLRKKP